MGEENVDVLKSKKYSTASDKHQILAISYFIPFDIRRSKWQTFVRKQFVEHQVAYIRDQIINVATAHVLGNYYFKNKSFVFARECLNVAWLQLFDWILLRLDHSKRDKSHKVDIELESSPIDSWILRNSS
ncbi:uncharacterized protein LOC143264303 [Megachile rotundata]|uniref:uncharacterized protein LOC143264303 n=1 Tax=Megachile rotundata TaxID=143995 RepID=UPI003FD2A7CD